MILKKGPFERFLFYSFIFIFFLDFLIKWTLFLKTKFHLFFIFMPFVFCRFLHKNSLLESFLKIVITEIVFEKSLFLVEINCK